MSIASMGVQRCGTGLVYRTPEERATTRKGQGTSDNLGGSDSSGERSLPSSSATSATARESTQGREVGHVAPTTNRYSTSIALGTIGSDHPL